MRDFRFPVLCLVGMCITHESLAVKGPHGYSKSLIPVSFKECGEIASAISNEFAQSLEDEGSDSPSFRLMDFHPEEFPAETIVNLDSLRERLETWFESQSDEVKSYGVRFKKLEKKKPLIELSFIFSGFLRNRLFFEENLSFLKQLAAAGVNGAAGEVYLATEEWGLYRDTCQWLKKHKTLKDVENFRTSVASADVGEQVVSLGKSLRSAGRIEEAEQVFRILNHSDHELAASLASSMYIHAYNQIVDQKGVERPTPELMFLLRKASKHLGNMMSDPEDTAYWVADKVDKLLEHYTLWFVNHPQLVKTLGDDFVSEAYSFFRKNEGTIRQIMNSNSYGAGGSKDLKDVLAKEGFVLVRVWHTQYNLDQHVWVHPSGLQVRIKPLTYEFTLGITYTNPVIWKKNKAKGLKQYQDGSFVIQDHANEVLKISSGFLIPSFVKGDWDTSLDESSLDQAMKKAHYMYKKADEKNVLLKYKKFEAN